jgi:hypothetical protein
VAEPPLKVTAVLYNQNAGAWVREIWFRVLTGLSAILNAIEVLAAVTT